jgi:hypothetical protein
MAKHIFISYSRSDQEYARRLAQDLCQRNYKVWIDDRIDYGSRWWGTIVKAIRSCGAFVVIMSPEAEESDWVEKEVMLAQEEAKPILPLLLHGKRFALLINTQYADVTSDRLPPPKFYERLSKILPTAGKPVSTAPSKIPRIQKTRAGGLSAASVFRKARLQPVPKPAANKFVCSKCGLPFNRQEDLDAHLANWHSPETGTRSERESSPNILQKISQSVRDIVIDEWICPECGLPFNRKEDLDTHLANWHS